MLAHQRSITVRWHHLEGLVIQRAVREAVRVAGKAEPTAGAVLAPSAGFGQLATCAPQA